MTDADEDPDLHELAKAVEELRAAVHDLKHDIRMLKVGLDKQAATLSRLAARHNEQPVGFGDRPSRGAGDQADDRGDAA